MNWHYADKGKQAGPVTDEELLLLLQAGKINEATLVWSPGMPNWVPYRQAKAANPVPPQTPAAEPLKLSGGPESPANNLADNPAWHYEDNGQQTGPVTEAELHRLLQTGKIDEATLVWRSGMPDWTPYGQVKASPASTSAAPSSPTPQSLKLSLTAESSANDLPDNLSWYYEDNGQQAGPIPSAALRRLLQTGKIDQSTLVWNSGLPNWLPYSEACKTANPPVNQPESIPASPSAPTESHSPTEPEVVCAECGRMFPTSETIRYGKARVCASCKPVFLQKLSEGASLNRNRSSRGTGGMEYAGFWIRWAARFLDGLILLVVLFAVNMLLAMLMGLFLGTLFSDTAKVKAPDGNMVVAVMAFELLFFAIDFVIIAAYECILVSKYGATLGKMACGIRVVRANGGQVGFGLALGRLLAKLLSCFTCGIGFIIAAFDAEKRALHDHICGTRVVYK